MSKPKGPKKSGYHPGSPKGRYSADGRPRQKCRRGEHGPKRNKHGRVIPVKKKKHPYEVKVVERKKKPL